MFCDLVVAGLRGRPSRAGVADAMPCDVVVKRSVEGTYHDEWFLVRFSSKSGIGDM